MGERTAAWALGSGMRACLVIDADSEFWELETNYRQLIDLRTNILGKIYA